jgi:hypothetical protein
MHRAPAVSFSTVRSRWHLRFIVALFFTAVVTLWGYWFWQSQPDGLVVAVACTLLGTALLALISWYQSAPSCLRWNGQYWHWSGFGDQSECRLSLRMDWQSGLLVSLQCESQPLVWLWLDACADIYQWNDLRRAIVSSEGVSPEGVDVPASLQHGDVA